MKKSFYAVGEFVKRYPIAFVVGIVAFIAAIWFFFFRSGENHGGSFVPADVSKDELEKNQSAGLSAAGYEAMASGIQTALDGVGSGGRYVFNELGRLSSAELKKLFNVYGKRPYSDFYLGSAPIVGRVTLGGDRKLNLIEALKAEFGSDNEELFNIWRSTGLW